MAYCGASHQQRSTGAAPSEHLVSAAVRCRFRESMWCRQPYRVASERACGVEQPYRVASERACGVEQPCRLAPERASCVSKVRPHPFRNQHTCVGKARPNRFEKEHLSTCNLAQTPKNARSKDAKN